MGVKEAPKGSNKGDSVSKWQKPYGINGEPWCAVIIGEKAKQGKVISPRIYSASSLRYIVKNYSWKLSDVIAGRYIPKAGDYRVKRRKGGGHIDMFVSWDTVKQEGIVIGGNVDDAVKLRKVTIKSMIADRTTHITEVTPTFFETIVRVPKYLVVGRKEMFVTWYGGKFHNKRTANGEKYDTTKLTAAHRTLKFGTKLLIKNKDKQMILTVNDRCPKNNVLDVTPKVLRELGLKSGRRYQISIIKEIK